SITWFGLVAPPGTPATLAQRINRDTVEMLRSAEVAERLQSLSLEAGAGSPADTAKFFADETALWGKVIKEAGIEPQKGAKNPMPDSNKFHRLVLAVLAALLLPTGVAAAQEAKFPSRAVTFVV